MLATVLASSAWRAPIAGVRMRVGRTDQPPDVSEAAEQLRALQAAQMEDKLRAIAEVQLQGVERPDVAKADPPTSASLLAAAGVALALLSRDVWTSAAALAELLPDLPPLPQAAAAALALACLVRAASVMRLLHVEASAAPAERHSCSKRRVPRSRSGGVRLCADADVLDEAPVGVHPGVLCDKTLNPITGWRFTDGAGYDLCEAEFLKLEPAEQLRFERVGPPITPRRALIAGVGVVAAARLLASAPPPRVARDADDICAEGGCNDIYELPQLTPAEMAVGLVFRPPQRR